MPDVTPQDPCEESVEIHNGTVYVIECKDLRTECRFYATNMNRRQVFVSRGHAEREARYRNGPPPNPKTKRCGPHRTVPYHPCVKCLKANDAR